MTTASLGRDFDRISLVYDDTRPPLDSETIEGLRSFLREHAWRSILEVGVGTGRIARPLSESGFRVAGVDASRGMLARAAAKGVPGLLRGTAYRLPFGDGAFDAVLFAHVLHMLDDPGAALREAGRVGRHGVLAVMDRGATEGEAAAAPEPTPRDALRRVLADLGYPELLRAGPRVQEQEILRHFPPGERRVLSDREVTEPVSKALESLEKRAYRHVLNVPPEELARAVALTRERVGNRTITYRRSEVVVWWPSAPGR